MREIIDDGSDGQIGACATAGQRAEICFDAIHRVPSSDGCHGRRGARPLGLGECKDSGMTCAVAAVTQALVRHSVSGGRCSDWYWRMGAL